VLWRQGNHPAPGRTPRTPRSLLSRVRPRDRRRPFRNVDAPPGSGPAGAVPTMLGVSISHHCPGRRLGDYWMTADTRTVWGAAAAPQGRTPAPPLPSLAPPRPDRNGSGTRRTPSCMRSEAPSALIRPVCRPVDGGGVSGIACRSPGPARSTCEEPPNERCAVGLLRWSASESGAGTEGHEWVPAAGGR
jgi:hypothetical protein